MLWSIRELLLLLYDFCEVLSAGNRFATASAWHCRVSFRRLFLFYVGQHAEVGFEGVSKASISAVPVSSKTLGMQFQVPIRPQRRQLYVWLQRWQHRNNGGISFSLLSLGSWWLRDNEVIMDDNGLEMLIEQNSLIILVLQRLFSHRALSHVFLQGNAAVEDGAGDGGLARVHCQWAILSIKY